jgi:hypothetical protein
VKKLKAISLAAILGLSISSVPALAAPKPTLAQIEAAKKQKQRKRKPPMLKLKNLQKLIRIFVH